MNISFVQKAAVVLLSSAFIFTSCNKDNPDPTVVYQNSTTSGGTGGTGGTGGGGTTNPSTDYFYAEVDGVEFQETLYTGIVSFGTLAITASENGSFPSIGISLPEDIAPGTYSLGSIMTPQAGYVIGNTANDQFGSDGSGSITITSHDETNDVISGTFNFLAVPPVTSTSTDTYNITNGEFTLNY